MPRRSRAKTGPRIRAAPVGRDSITLTNLANHSVKVNVSPRQNQKHIAGYVARAVDAKANYRCLAVVLLNRFK